MTLGDEPETAYGHTAVRPNRDICRAKGCPAPAIHGESLCAVHLRHVRRALDDLDRAEIAGDPQATRAVSANRQGPSPRDFMGTRAARILASNSRLDG